MSPRLSNCFPQISHLMAGFPFGLAGISTTHVQTTLSYLFAGIPILNALRLIITINTIINNEQMAPTKKIVVNAMSFGTVVVVVVVVPASVAVVTSAVYRLINTPAITGPIAPPIILIC